MYIGLSKNDAIGCFDFGKAPDTKLSPEVVRDSDGVKYEKVINEAHTDCFVIDRITLNGGEYRLNINDSYGVYIVTSGEGELCGEEYSKKIKKGDYFFMPACLMNKFLLKGNIEVVECY